MRFIKESACNVGDPCSFPGSGRSPGEGNGYPLQYSCLENSMDRGVWWSQSVGQNWVTNTHTHTEFVHYGENYALPKFICWSPNPQYFKMWLYLEMESLKGQLSWISVIEISLQFSSVQSLSRVWLSATPWPAAHQASLSITNSRSLLTHAIVSVMPSNHLILCHPLSAPHLDPI